MADPFNNFFGDGYSPGAASNAMFGDAYIAGANARPCETKTKLALARWFKGFALACKPPMRIST